MMLEKELTRKVIRHIITAIKDGVKKWLKEECLQKP